MIEDTKVAIDRNSRALASTPTMFRYLFNIWTLLLSQHPKSSLASCNEYS